MHSHRRRVGFVILLALPAIAGCLEPATTTCDGVLCPASDVCVVGVGCVPNEAALPCAGAAELAPCELGGLDGLCRGQVCVPMGCGNGVVDPDEACDDGNVVDGDACRRDCRSDLSCGNGILDPDEACDCGRDDATQPTACAGVNDDDPSAACNTTCTRRCGDGEITGAEDCEPDVALAEDCAGFGFYGGTPSCNQVCRYDLSGCVGECGDGIVQADAGEVCDQAPPDDVSCVDVGADWGAPTCANNCVVDAIHACNDYGWALQIAAPAEEVWSDGSAVLTRDFMTVTVRQGAEATPLPGSFTSVRGGASVALLIGPAGLARWDVEAGLAAIELPAGVAPVDVTAAAIDDDGNLAVLVGCTLWDQPAGDAWRSEDVPNFGVAVLPGMPRPAAFGCNDVIVRAGTVTVAGVGNGCSPDGCSFAPFVAVRDAAATWDGSGLHGFGGGARLWAHPGHDIFLAYTSAMGSCTGAVTRLVGATTTPVLDDLCENIISVVGTSAEVTVGLLPQTFGSFHANRVIDGVATRLEVPAGSFGLTMIDGRLATTGARVYTSEHFDAAAIDQPPFGGGYVGADVAAVTPGGTGLFVGRNPTTNDEEVRTDDGVPLYQPSSASIAALAGRTRTDLAVIAGNDATVANVDRGVATVAVDAAATPIDGATTIAVTTDGTYLVAGVRPGDGLRYAAITATSAWTRLALPAAVQGCTPLAIAGTTIDAFDVLVTACADPDQVGVWHYGSGAWNHDLAEPVVELAQANDGALFARTTSTLWRRTAAAWADLGALPAGVRRVAAVGANEAYAIGPSDPLDATPALLRFDGARWSAMRRVGARAEASMGSYDAALLANVHGLWIAGTTSTGGEGSYNYVDVWRRDAGWDGVAP